MIYLSFLGQSLTIEGSLGAALRATRSPRTPICRGVDQQTFSGPLRHSGPFVLVRGRVLRHMGCCGAPFCLGVNEDRMHETRGHSVFLAPADQPGQDMRWSQEPRDMLTGGSTQVGEPLASASPSRGVVPAPSDLAPEIVPWPPGSSVLYG